ncbi:hypothetical protein GCM10010911_15440 [Paenibacillus nasutitermitis]|uniref:Spore germination protein (Amino acid permease) n=2 Tax=Paenibacillus nasutitermitis TaxID=1652958 RepID=A0A916YSZ3_9BACL|nr:hypothetical protein GCM10010911_15440 [Paenibacillus nasutitermitis]
MVFSLMNGLCTHVIVNPMVLGASGRDAWITALVSGALFIVWSLLLVWLIQRSGQQKWHAWLADKTHPSLSWLLIAPLIIILYMIGGTTVVQTARWNITNYLPQSPELLLVVALVVICTILALWGLRVIAILSGILLPIVVVLGIFVAVSNSSMKDYHLLQPMLEQGWSPVLKGMVYTGGGFVELIVLIALQHRIKTKIRAWPVVIYAVFVTLITVGPLVGAITEFGPIEAANQMISPYEQWRLVKIGQYVEHVDFFSIFQWLSGACIRISLSVYLIIELLPIKRIRTRLWVIVGIMLSYLTWSLFPINEYIFFLWLSRYYMPISLTVLLALSFLWMLIALFSKPVKEGSV